MKWVIILHILLGGEVKDITITNPSYHTYEKCVVGAYLYIRSWQNTKDTKIEHMYATCVQRKIEQKEIWF